MERLTERHAGIAVFKDKYNLKEAAEKLARYEELEEQELLLQLPCAIGTKVYDVWSCLAPSCDECNGFLLVDNCYTQYKARIFEQNFDFIHLKDFGKFVFLSREEAEKALAEVEQELKRKNAYEC